MKSTPARPWLLLSGLASVLLASCGGGSESVDDSPATGPFATTSVNANVVLPSGVSLSPGQLKVRTSADEAAPSSNGAVTVHVLATGSQLGVVMSPAGNPMLMGWLDATHHSISAATTAQVYAYFALGSAYMPSAVSRDAMIAGIDQAQGLDALEAVIKAQLATSVDAFAQRNPALQQAVANFATQFKASVAANQLPPGWIRPMAVLVAEDKQSGIAIIEDPPFAAHVTNSFRRRAWAFVERVSYRKDGVEVADPVNVTNFEVPPTTGLSGGVTGTLTDIYKAHLGNQPTAYADVSAPEGGMTLQLVDGADRTTYKVTVVGAGATQGAYGLLTEAQQNKQLEVALQGFTQDFLLPTVANALLGSGLLSNKHESFINDLITEITSDLAGLLASYGNIRQEMEDGKYSDAASDLATIGIGSNSLGELINKALGRVIDSLNDSKQYKETFVNVFDGFDKAMDAAGGVLQVYDSLSYLNDLVRSSYANQWKVVVSPSKALLNPLTSVLDVGGTVDLVATVSGAEDVAGYSYRWISTQKSGYLIEINGNASTRLTDFCSSSNKVRYVREGGGGSDTVSVKIFSGSSCKPENGYQGGVTATVYSPKVTVTPAISTVKNGQSVTMTGTIEGMRPLAAGETLAFKWTNTRVTGDLAGSPDGGLATPVEGTSATYKGDATRTGIDIVTLGAYVGTTRVGTANTKIVVGENLAVESGRTFEEHWKDDNCHNAMYIAIPKIKKARQYDVYVSNMHGYFGEFNTWTVYVSDAGVTIPPAADRGNEILIGIGGGGGGGADCISTVDQRFGPWYSTAVVDVIVRL